MRRKDSWHIVLLRFSSLGDVVLQTAIAHWLKSHYGEKLQLSFVTSQEFAALVEQHPALTRVISFDRRQESVSQLAGRLRRLHAEHPIDLMLDLHATTRSILLRTLLWQIPRLVVEKRRLARFLMVNAKGLVRFFSRRPHVERIPAEWQGLLHAPVLKAFPRTQLQALPQDAPLPGPYIVLAPVASFAPKRWPMESFLELAQRLLADEALKEFRFVVIAGPADTHCELLNQIRDPRLINLQGKTKLTESMRYLRFARLVIGNDSGMNHIAEAYGVPVLTLFGPTHEAFGFGAHLPQSKNLSQELWCRPCSTTGNKACFRQEQFCFTALTPELVHRKAREVV